MKHILYAITIVGIFCAPVVIMNCNRGGTVVAADKSTEDENAKPDSSTPQITFTLNVITNKDTVVFELNTSTAAKDLYGQLPLTIAVEDFGSNEKIFYPPEKLGTTNTPLAEAAKAGTLAYYAPWGDVVMFYNNFSSAPGLYKLGNAISGTEHIENLTGTILIIKGAAK